MSFSPLFSVLSSLPVTSIAEEVVLSVLEGNATVLAAGTGSGKTLVVSSMLAEISDERVVVCVPRRFLAMNAAETIAELAGVEVGGLVGYAVGSNGGDESRFCASTKLLFVTYGYAISSGLVNRASSLVFDEVHEAATDISLARALVQRRLAAGEKVKLMEMSATVNAERQAGYWAGVAAAQVFQAEGKTFPCERRHVLPMGNDAIAIAEIVRGLITGDARKGIVVFRPGRGEVEDTVAAITEVLVAAGISAEVCALYGEMAADERKKAVAAPTDGSPKVVVSTNVLESGANVPWLDAAISCGTGKELVAQENGALLLDMVNLPQWRLTQQLGRCNRFRAGIFVLASHTPWELRELETTPEIKRLPASQLVMHCAAFGIHPEELTFDYPLEEGKLEEGITRLMRLGLISAECKLTEAGKFVSRLPVSFETGAMLWHAKQTSVLGAALKLAAVMETDGIRKDFRMSHMCDSSSDWLDGLKAFTLALAADRADYNSRKQLLEAKNIGFKRLEAAKNLYRKLLRSFPEQLVRATSIATDEQLRQCILAGSLDKLFKYGYGGTLSPVVSESMFASYRIGNGSVVSSVREFAIGNLRTIKPKNGRGSFTVLEKITRISKEDLMAFAALRPEIFRLEIAERYTRVYLFNDYLVEESYIQAQSVA